MSTLKLKGSTSGYVELTAPATAGDNTITLPTTAGTVAVKDASNNTEVGTGVTIGSPSSNTFTVSTSGSERIRVNSSGNVGIGTDNPGYKLDVRPTPSDPTSGSPPVGALVQIRADDATVGNGPSLALLNLGGSKETAWRISAVSTSGNNGDLVFHGYAGGAAYTEAARFTSAGNLAFPSGQGIDFSAAGNAAGMTSELLDDYEEGSFTPRWGDPSSPYTSPAPTYSTQRGDYTKVGNVVYYDVHLITTAWNGAGTAMFVHGLPFTTRSSGYQQGGGGIFCVQGVDSASAISNLTTQIANSTTNIQLYYSVASSSNNYNSFSTSEVNEAGTVSIRVSGFYFTDS